MLTYFLAIIIVITSLNLYFTAFIRPKIHRRDDFLWSALGLFYGLTLWICAGRITGALLLSQFAIIVVAIAFIWENMKLRKAWLTNENNTLEGFSVLSLILNTLAKLSKKQPSEKVSPKPENQKVEKTQAEKENFPEITPEIKEALDQVEEEVVTPASETVEEKVTGTQQTIKDNISELKEDISELEDKVESLVEDEKEDSTSVIDKEAEDKFPQKKGFLGGIFGSIFKKKKPQNIPEKKVGKESPEDMEDNFVDAVIEENNDNFFDDNQESPQNIPTVIEESPSDEPNLAESSPDEETVLEVSPDAQTVLEDDENNDITDDMEEEIQDREESVDVVDNEQFNLDENQEKEEDSSESPLASTEEEISPDEEDLIGEENTEIPPEDTINSLDDLTDKLTSESSDLELKDEEKTDDTSTSPKDESFDNILEDWDKKD